MDTSHSNFTREEWANLRSSVPMFLSEGELDALRGTNDPMALAEVEQIYLPLTRLINLHFDAARKVTRVTDDFLGRPAVRRPYVVAVAGSVAVGKSTIARLLKALLARWPDHPHVDLVTTDGFLYPTRHLQSAGLMSRKGFPESYDVRRMIHFLADIRADGQADAPVYSHQAYDIVPGEMQPVRQPDILIFEGLNVLQIGNGLRHGQPLAYTSSDFFDLSIYVDADEEDVARWYLERFMLLKHSAFQDPSSYFHHLAEIPDKDARSFAENLWRSVNLLNLKENILPTRSRADVVLHKKADHEVDRLWLRRL